MTIGEWNTTPANSLASTPTDRLLCTELCICLDGEETEPISHGTLPDGRIMAQSSVAAEKHGVSAEGLSVVKLMERVRAHLDGEDWRTEGADMAVHLDAHPCLPAATVMVILQPQDDGEDDG